MNENLTTKTYKRVNVILPQKTLRLLNRLIEKGGRSRFIDEAVRFYIEEVGRTNLKKQLRKGAIERAERDLCLSEEWFVLENEI